MTTIRMPKRHLRLNRGLRPKHLVALLPLAVHVGIVETYDASGHTTEVIADSTIVQERLESGTWSTTQHPHSGGGHEGLLPRASSSSKQGFEGESRTCSAYPTLGLQPVKQWAGAGKTPDESRADTIPASNYQVEDEGKFSTSSGVARASPSASALKVEPGLHAPPPPQWQAASSNSVSAVLVVTLQDAHLATLLMASLRACGAMDIFQDFFVVVPGQELAQVKAILSHSSNIAPKDEAYSEETPHQREIIMVDERQLLLAAGVRKVETWWSTYSLQMALKLVASSLMQTPFYLTLDADVLCTKDKLSEQDLVRQGKGNYLPEGREVHPKWWSRSARTLRVEEDPTGSGFGVTPAVLSTAGAKLTLGRLREVHGSDDGFLSRIFDLWVGDPDWRWSEYTLYRSALDHFDTFDALHAVGTTRLLGDESVWYSKQFEAWNVTAAFDEESAAGFVVVQSSARIGVGEILRKLDQTLEAQGVIPPAGRSAPSLRGRILRQMGWSRGVDVKEGPA